MDKAKDTKQVDINNENVELCNCGCKCNSEDCTCDGKNCQCDGETCNCDCCKSENGECCDECGNEDFEKLVAEKQDLSDKLLKVLADYQNMQRDNDKRLDIALTQLKAKVAFEIIAVLDDLAFAMKAKEKIAVNQPEVNDWINGLIVTMKKMEVSLTTLGIKVMDVKVGDAYDSVKHEAIGVVFEGEPNTIHQLVQNGYEMAEREIIVRPARVIVCKSK